MALKKDRQEEGRGRNKGEKKGIDYQKTVESRMRTILGQCVTLP